MSVQDLQNLISLKFTPQLLNEIISQKSGLNGVQVRGIEIGAESKKGDSYLSNMCRFRVDATGFDNQNKEQSTNVSIFVKLIPSNQGRRKTFRSADFFENEAIFYEKVWRPLDDFQKSKNIDNAKLFTNIPSLLSAHIDGNNDYIALEDLCFSGYRTVDRADGVNYETAIEILKLFAHFHGLAVAMKNQQPDEFEKIANTLKETYFAEKYRTWYGNFQQKIFAIIRDAVSKELPQKYLDKLNAFIQGDFYGRLCEVCTVKGPFSVITHGDAWIPNFMMKFGPNDTIEKVMMIDFQLARYTTLTTDITMFLFSCVKMSILTEHWDDFIAEYHRHLVDTLEVYGTNRNLITLEALKNDIKENITFGVGLCMEGLIMSMLEEDEVSDFDTITGDDAVPLESIWIINPFKDQAKRRRIASMIQLVVDNELI